MAKGYIIAIPARVEIAAEFQKGIEPYIAVQTQVSTCN